MELDGVARGDYWKVVEHCYLCDMCFMTKCPYVPPHEWNVDFPHLMLRAKAVANRKGTVRARDRILSATDTVGRLVSLPVAAPVVNAANKLRPARVLLEKTLGVHRDARVPEYHSDTLRKRLAGHDRRGVRQHGENHRQPQSWVGGKTEREASQGIHGRPSVTRIAPRVTTFDVENQAPIQ